MSLQTSLRRKVGKQEGDCGIIEVKGEEIPQEDRNNQHCPVSKCQWEVRTQRH